MYSLHFAIFDGDLTEEQKAQLIGFAHQSPVFDVVTKGVPVEVSLQST